MSNLFDQIDEGQEINEAVSNLQNLIDGKEKLTEIETIQVRILEGQITGLRAVAQDIRHLRLAEAQRGEMLVCFTTVMLDEFNTDV